MKYAISLFLLLITGALILWATRSNEKNNSPEGELQEWVSEKNKNIDDQFKAYWYNGEAEITSYNIKQARYGEIHSGKAVMIFVTEHLSPETHVKAYNDDNKDVSVLKLNATRNFNTGIYPYSIMHSTFTPVDISKKPGTLRLSFSAQEWCGHVYQNIDLRGNRYKVVSHSYFPDEADQNYHIPKAFLEDEIWTRIKISPETLPSGEIDMIPSAMSSRFSHKPLASFKAVASFKKNDNQTMDYAVVYKEIDRSISINFDDKFPYKINSWEETAMSGIGENAKKITTTASIDKSIKSDYWSKNTIADSVFRKQLNL